MRVAPVPDDGAGERPAAEAEDPGQAPSGAGEAGRPASDAAPGAAPATPDEQPAEDQAPAAGAPPAEDPPRPGPPRVAASAGEASAGGDGPVPARAPSAVDDDAAPGARDDDVAPAARDPDAAGPAVAVEGLSVRFGWPLRRVEVLHEVDLTVPARGWTVVYGPRGAGKTVLLRALLGLARPSGGRTTVLGRDPRRDPLGVRAAVGYLPDAPSFYPGMHALGVGGFLADLYPGWERHRYEDLLDRLGVPLGRRVSDLDPDARARLALAAALGHAPPLLLVDLPRDLDPRARRRLLDAAAAEVTEGAALLVTDRAEELARARRLVLLAQGRVRAAGAPEEVRRSVLRGRFAPGDAPDLPEGAALLAWTAARGEAWLRVVEPGARPEVAGARELVEVGLAEACAALTAEGAAPPRSQGGPRPRAGPDPRPAEEG